VDLKGRCIGCGFLAKRSIDPTPSYYEIEQSERDTGHVWQHRAAETGIYIQTEPECFRHVASIRGEIRKFLTTMQISRRLPSGCSAKTENASTGILTHWA